MNLGKIKISGLRTVLRRFNENGKSAKSGRWYIGKGGYDLAWELYYTPDGETYRYPVIDCIQGAWDFKGVIKNLFGLSEADLKKITKIIMEEYDDVCLTDEEAKHFTFNR